MTPHIEASIGQIAPLVMMPGDPLRAKWISDTYLENARLVNQVRGMYAYTGTYKGVEITVMASGMGMPSMGIYSYELYSVYGVDTILRIGSAGAYVADLALYDLLLVQNSVTESTYAKVQSGSFKTSLPASEELNCLIEKTASTCHIPLRKTDIECSDVFYKEENDYAPWVEKGCLACEMESFALFHNASVFGKKAACILTVSNNWETKEETTPDERQHAFSQMVELALESLIQVRV